MESKIPVRVRLANDSTYITIKVSKGSFKATNEFKDEIFGVIDNMTVAMKIEDYEKLNRSFDTWDLVIIDEKGNDLIVMTPNGDTQYMTKQQYESYKIKRQDDRSN